MSGQLIERSRKAPGLNSWQIFFDAQDGDLGGDGSSVIGTGISEDGLVFDFHRSADAHPRTRATITDLTSSTILRPSLADGLQRF